MNDLNLLPSQAKFQAERMHLKKVINQRYKILNMNPNDGKSVAVFQISGILYLRLVKLI